MNLKPETRNGRPEIQGAFTLIELLIVIAIIAILAGLLFPVMGVVNANRMRSVARAELTQITTAIDKYYGAYHSYPQDNPLNLKTNALYLELSGMQLVGTKYRSLDGSYSVDTNAVMTVCNIPGLLNASTSIQATDDRPAISSYLTGVKPAQLATNNPAANQNVRFLICSADDSPWNYRSTNPTNNPGSYDLWIDLVAGGKTNRIANWNK